MTQAPKKLKGNGIYGDLQQVIYSIYRKENERNKEMKFKKKEGVPSEVALHARLQSECLCKNQGCWNLATVLTHCTELLQKGIKVIRKPPLHNALYYFLAKNESQMKSQFNCLKVSPQQLFLHSKKRIHYRH